MVPLSTRIERTAPIPCAPGTYVRTLCADVGEALGCGAHLETLRRTRSGDFDIEQALPLARVLAMDKEELRQAITPMRTFVSTR